MIDKYLLTAKIKFKVGSPNADWHLLGINAAPNVFIDGYKMMTKFVSINNSKKFLHEGDTADCEIEVFSAFKGFSHEKGSRIYFMSASQIACSNINFLHHATTIEQFKIIEENSFLTGVILDFVPVE